MIAGIFFGTTRVLQLLFLIPIIGLLSYLVHGYVAANALTPDYILVLFIVSVLAGVWAAATLIFYWTARKAGLFVAFIDLAIFGALIGGVATLRGIAPASCSSLTSFNGYAQLAPFANNWSHACGVLKGAFALGIICVITFFFSFFWALWVHHHYRKNHPDYTTRRVVTERYHRGSGSNRRSSSRSTRGGGGGRDPYARPYPPSGRAIGPPPGRSSSAGGGYGYDGRRSGSRGPAGRASSRGAYESRRSYV